MTDPAERLRRHAVEPLKARFVGRDEVTDLIALAVVAGEHLFLYGPPGTAKSALVRGFAGAVRGRYFEYLLTRFSEPNEIFGPIDLAKLRDGTVATVTTGMLPEAEFAFLDELFNANSAILNNLLTVLNERVYRRGAETHRLPLVSLFSASNHLPEDDALQALFDRFLLRCRVEPLPRASLPALLAAGWALERGDETPAPAEGPTADDLRQLARWARDVNLAGVTDAYADAVLKVRDLGVALTDRRAVKLLKLLAASAVLCGRAAADRSDLWVLRYRLGPRGADRAADGPGGGTAGVGPGRRGAPAGGAAGARRSGGAGRRTRRHRPGARRRRAEAGGGGPPARARGGAGRRGGVGRRRRGPRRAAGADGRPVAAAGLTLRIVHTLGDIPMTSLRVLALAVIAGSSTAAHAADGPVAGTFVANGVKLRYVVQGEGEPVVLLHGLHASAEMNWKLPGIMPALAKNYRVVALDFPGHGGSDRPDDAAAYGLQMVEDVVALLDHLSIKRAHVVGYSMGGMVAMKLMARHPERVKSAVVGGMGWLRDGGASQKFFEQTKGRNSAWTPAACVRGMAKLAVSEDELKAIRLPVVVVIGDADPLKKLFVAPLREVRKDWPVVEIEGAGHLTCVLKPKFADEIAAWLAKQATD